MVLGSLATSVVNMVTRALSIIPIPALKWPCIGLDYPVIISHFRTFQTVNNALYNETMAVKRVSRVKRASKMKFQHQIGNSYA